MICEPSGHYQDKLLQTARRLGHRTAYVNAEAVSKSRVVESNDTGKTDIKDPHVIDLLARLGKTLRHRTLAAKYAVLRKLGAIYDEQAVAITRFRCRLERVQVALFCDYSFKKDFLYSQSGRALVSAYGCNPYRIVTAGWKRFRKRMKQLSPRIWTKTLERLWREAESWVRNEFAGSSKPLRGRGLFEARIFRSADYPPPPTLRGFMNHGLVTEHALRATRY